MTYCGSIKQNSLTKKEGKMRKRNLITMMIVLLVTVCSILRPFNTAQAEEKVYKWRCQSFLSAGFEWFDYKWAEALYVASGGRIQVKVFAGGEVVPTEDILESVASGMIEFGSSCPAYDAKKIDVANLLFGVPFAWNNRKQDEQLIYVGGMLEIGREAYAEKGLRLLSIEPADPYQLLSKKPANNLNELRALKIRTTGGVAELLKELGVKTTFVPFEEIYTNLATGVIDGIFVGGLGTYAQSSWPEVAKYYYPQGFVNPLNCHRIMNKELWDSLPGDIKAIIQLVSEKQAVNSSYWNHAITDIGAKVLEEKFNCKAIYWPESDIKEIQKVAAKMMDQEAQKSERCARLVKIIKDYVYHGKYDAEREKMLSDKIWMHNYPLYEQANYKPETKEKE